MIVSLPVTLVVNVNSHEVDSFSHTVSFEILRFVIVGSGLTVNVIVSLAPSPQPYSFVALITNLYSPASNNGTIIVPVAFAVLSTARLNFSVLPCNTL